MDRRAFIIAVVALWGCRQREEPKEAMEASKAAPSGIAAQKSANPVIGFLGSASLVPWAPYVAAFRRGLNETGYVEDKNVAIEFSWAEGRYERLPGLASDLVRRQVAVIFTTGAG